MGVASNFGLESYGTLCDACGIPLDAEHFDRSSIVPVDWASFQAGQSRTLARFTLPPQYCGILDCFSQFTDRWARHQEYRTPGVGWSLRANGRPLFPYEDFADVINPWGYGSFAVRIRLDEGATVELVARRASGDEPTGGFCELGGRICGRYWYNPAYGGRVER